MPFPQLYLVKWAPVRLYLIQVQQWGRYPCHPWRNWGGEGDEGKASLKWSIRSEWDTYLEECVQTAGISIVTQLKDKQYKYRWSLSCPPSGHIISTKARGKEQQNNLYSAGSTCSCLKDLLSVARLFICAELSVYLGCLLNRGPKPVRIWLRSHNDLVRL